MQEFVNKSFLSDNSKNLTMGFQISISNNRIDVIHIRHNLGIIVNLKICVGVKKHFSRIYNQLNN